MSFVLSTVAAPTFMRLRSFDQCIDYHMPFDLHCASRYRTLQCALPYVEGVALTLRFGTGRSRQLYTVDSLSRVLKPHPRLVAFLVHSASAGDVLQNRRYKLTYETDPAPNLYSKAFLSQPAYIRKYSSSAVSHDFTALRDRYETTRRRWRSGRAPDTPTLSQMLERNLFSVFLLPPFLLLLVHRLLLLGTYAQYADLRHRVRVPDFFP
uniref:Uncharacterized protein n=1 Tax=Rhipicephalus zambeziensis TaxID=60191 RepID=A0A224Y7G7_9ACAR